MSYIGFINFCKKHFLDPIRPDLLQINARKFKMTAIQHFVFIFYDF